MTNLDHKESKSPEIAIAVSSIVTVDENLDPQSLLSGFVDIVARALAIDQLRRTTAAGRE